MMPTPVVPFTIAPLLAALLLGPALSCGNEEADNARQDVSEQARNARPGAIPSPSAQRINPRQQAKRNFVRQANAICRRLMPEAEEIRRRYLFGSDPATQQRGLLALAREINIALREMKALRQPADGRRGILLLYRAAEAGITELVEAANDRKVADRILSGVDPFAKAALLARAHDLKSCQTSARATDST